MSRHDFRRLACETRRRSGATARLFARENLRLSVCLLSLLAVLPAVARAQLQPPALTSDNFSIDLVTGPIVGPNRVVSLGGAYTALGYGIDNAVITPAAYAARTLWDTRWFEFDVTVDYNPGVLLRQIDFINNGKTGVRNSNFLFVTLGASAIVGDLGFGGIVRSQNYRIGSSAELELVLANYGACYAFLDGQLLVGVSARTASLNLRTLQGDDALGSFTHTGPEAGAILGLADLPYRVGVAVRSAVEAKRDGTLAQLSFRSPKTVTLPAEVAFGLAYQFGNRPLNRRWVNPHERRRALRNEMLMRRLRRQREQAEREREALDLPPTAASTPSPPRSTGDTETPPRSAGDVQTSGPVPAWLLEPRDPAFWRAENQRIAEEDAELEREVERAEARHSEAIRALSRKYLLVSTDVLLIGETKNGIGLERYLLQERQDSGKHTSVSFRLGVEGEPVPDRLRLRVGTYLEPSRFVGVDPRLHVTMGSDLKLFAFDMFGLVNEFEFRVTATLDVAERYRNFGVSVGIWH